MGIELIMWLALFAVTALALMQKDPPSSSIDWDESCDCPDCLDQFYEFEEDDDISKS
jgi:hypothetical protein